MSVQILDLNHLQSLKIMDELKVSIKLKGRAKNTILWLCEELDMQPAQVVRMCVSDKITSMLGCPPSVTVGTPTTITADSTESTSVSPEGHQPRVRTRVTKDLSLDKSNSSKDASRDFFKSFIGKIEYKKFPERVSKEIKNQWEAILESKLTPAEMAEAYNQYVTDSKSNESIPCHPNAWISGHGWENTEMEDKDEPRGNYDF
jgi:hypothetical protein